MRRLREELKFKEKQAQRQKIIDAQVERLRQLKNREDELINKQVCYSITLYVNFLLD